MPVTRESINEHCGWAPNGCHSMIIREGLGDAVHGIPESDLFPYATTLHPRACPLLAETLSGASAWWFAKGDILYLYIMCVCERNNKKCVDFCYYKLNRYSTWLALQGIVIWLYMNIVVHVVFQTYLVSMSRCVVSCKVSADLVALIRIRVRISVE